MVLYTSGSTGRPKGVPLSHDGQLWAVRSRIGAGGHGRQKLLVAAPLFHMNALGISKFAFAAGASVVLMPQFDARQFVEAIGRFKVTSLTSVPTMLALAMRERETLARTDLSSVESVRTGSAPITQSLVDEVRHAFPNAALILGYGTTESGPIAFGARAGLAKPDLALGWPLPGVEVRLIAPDGEETDEGELWIRTPANMTGYINLPAKTQEVLTADGWYKSADVFRRDAAGAYTFVGRTDDMFVCGGENIYPGEVEAMLEGHPDIARASDVPIKAKFCAQERGAQLRNQFLRCVIARAEPVLQIPIETRLMARPMRQLVERHIVEVIRALEPGECRHRDKISARHIVGFAVALADVGASFAQECVGKLIARVGIADAHWFPTDDAVGEVLALVDIENRILAHHWDQACRRAIVHALVADLQLLHEINFRSALAFADVAAQLRRLLECQKARRAISGRLRHPQQNDVAS